MPIYEYRCDSCGHELDALQKVSDAPLTDCPECSAARLRRLISRPSFRLKGSGWYETDFKSEKEKRRNLVGTPEDKSPGGETKPAGKDGKAKDGGETKTDKKTEKKTETKKDSGTAAA